MATILVLDDEPDAVMLMHRILCRMGHQVSVFTEEEQALEYAGRCRVDLAILDVNLKVMSGIEVLAELKKINPAMHVMMLTGLPTLDTAKKAVDLGADHYCIKPIEIDELQGKIVSILGAGHAKG